MQKLTTGLAVTFMVLSIVLVMLSNRKQSNLMEKALPVAAPTQSAPAAPKPAEKAPAPAPATPATPAPAPAQGSK